MNQRVYIVEDDTFVRAHISFIAESAGFAIESYDSPSSFLNSYAGSPGCLISDFLMPGMSGLELQRKLKEFSFNIPVILISSFSDVGTVRKAFKGGAIDFLQKPIDPGEFISAIREAFAEDAEIRSVSQRKQTLGAFLDRLTAREHQILDMLLSGKTNKHVAKELALSTRTVEAHRANIMKKMNSSSFQELLCVVSNR